MRWALQFAYLLEICLRRLLQRLLWMTTCYMFLVLTVTTIITVTNIIITVSMMKRLSGIPESVCHFVLEYIHSLETFIGIRGGCSMSIVEQCHSLGSTLVRLCCSEINRNRCRSISQLSQLRFFNDIPF